MEKSNADFTPLKLDWMCKSCKSGCALGSEVTARRRRKNVKLSVLRIYGPPHNGPSKILSSSLNQEINRRKHWHSYWLVLHIEMSHDFMSPQEVAP